jgi:molecular chaperone HscB
MTTTCWNCGAEVSSNPAPSAPGRFCPNCKSLQPPPADYFEIFDIPRKLTLDPKDLEKRFYALSRQLHPDLFSRRSARERDYSLDATAILNDAYRTLRDPVARAMYVLKLEGFDIGEQGTKEVPPELLEEVFELNMALEELRSGDHSVTPQLVEARQRFEDMRDEVDRRLGDEFAAWDIAPNRDTLAAIRGLLNRRKYITNLIAQANEATANVSDRV